MPEGGSKRPLLPDIHPDTIAIVGMAGRFPEASTLAEFWRNLREKRVTISRFSDDELEDNFDAATRAQPNFVAARPVLDNVDLFDAEFFGIHGREAALMDPQHRVFLEIAWEALESAGLDPKRFGGEIGVFAGGSMPTYFLNNLCADRAAVADFTTAYQLDGFPTLLGAMPDTLATRVAYKLDLRGPALTVQSACSTSLLAVAQACQSLLLFQCDAALAGGVSITFPQKRGYLYFEGGMGARDGVCRPLDADAAGTVFGSGAGVVVLRRLEDALADNDRIFAVIRGSAVNNDGAGKIGFTAPSAEGQARVIEAAHAAAEVDAASIGYVEMHGTATPLGDPIEVEGLKRAFGNCGPRRNFCTLGSAKANIGHLDAAAGVTGLIKTALSLYHEEIPPLAGFSTPNPRIDLSGSPFQVATEVTAWPRRSEPRRAGVSSFGVGGTNVHVVLEEAPATFVLPISEPGPFVLPLSGRSAAAVMAIAAALKTHLLAFPNLPIDAVAQTLQSGRRAFDHRVAVVASDRNEAIAELGRVAGRTHLDSAERRPHVVFMFPGQGSQYPGMGRSLYHSVPLFRDIIDAGAKRLKPILKRDIRELLYAASPDEEADDHPIRATVFAQPALFLTQYALAKLWMSRGVMPDSMIGHSVGELVAACLSGVVAFEDALDLIAVRASLMQAAPAGAMLAVRAPEPAVRALLDKDLSIAAINAPSLCVVAGPLAAIDALMLRLAAQAIQHRKLHTSHAFHSAMMDGVVAALAETANRIVWQAPRIPFVSCVTGQWASQETSASGQYWARHCREPVRFAEALETLARNIKPVLLEVGPGRTLATFAAQSLPKGNYLAIIPSLPEFAGADNEARVLADAIGRLWTCGVSVEWPVAPARGRVDLPTYPFQRKRYWIDAPATVQRAPSRRDASASDATHPSLQTRTPMDFPMPVASPHISPTPTPAPIVMQRRSQICAETAQIIETLSGEAIAETDWDTSYLELGFDSLFLGQMAQQVQRKYGVKITFRQLLGEYPSIAALAGFIDAALPAEAISPEAPPASPAAPLAGIAPSPEDTSSAHSSPRAQPSASVTLTADSDLTATFQMQLAAMQRVIERQLDAVRRRTSQPAGHNATAAPLYPFPAPPEPAPAPAIAGDIGTIAEPETRISRFRMFDKRSPVATLTPAQKTFVEDLTSRISNRMASSKAYAAQHRPHLADPRSVSGFRAEWKEAIFPIVAAKAKGSKLWDVDGNAYVDLVNGYGQTVFGHSPDFVVSALHEQLAKGFPIGPQSDAAGDVAGRIAQMVGLDRVTFCNTGSEAVMAAMRVARAVTGRDTVVVFANDYHGQFDEVLVKGSRRGAPRRALPISAGIPASAVSNMVVLAYGEDESLTWIRANADTLAAVIVEPIQSRHPELRPVAFLKELRTITAESGAALVFDEVVTGFRTHPGGAQAVFGIKADMATYGKVIGGGMPIGILAGARTFMDALDGGAWAFGDDSVPETAPIFFAGTFVRHPLVIAAAQSVLTHLESEGAKVLEALAEKTRQLVERLNADLARRGLSTRAETFSSWFMVSFEAEDRLGGLFYLEARYRGLNIQEGFPCFMTTAHDDADYSRIETIFSETLDALKAVGVLAGRADAKERIAVVADASDVQPPPDDHDVRNTTPLTEMQKEVWLAAQLGDTASCAFNESFKLEFDGVLDVGALRNAINDVIARHDALRTSFGETGEAMFVGPDVIIDPTWADLTTDSAPDQRLALLLMADAQTPFDLSNGPLVRTILAKLGEERHVLCFTAHHIVFDGWSAGVVIGELATCYAARRTGAAPSLAPAPQYRAYALAQVAKLPDQDEATKSFWKEQFANIASLPELPTDRPRPKTRTFSGSTYTSFIDQILTRKIKRAGAQHGCTPFATLFAAFHLLMGRLSEHRDLVVAVPTAGQSLLEDSNLVGHCVNLLPIRVAYDPALSVAAQMGNVRQALWRAFDHQSITLGTLVRELDVKRTTNRLPLTEIQFNFEKFGGDVEFSGLSTGVRPNAKAACNFDLFFNVAESAEGLRIDCDFNTDVFELSTIERWTGHFRTILEGLVEDADQSVGSIALMSREERGWMVDTLNHTHAEFSDSPLHRLIEAQALRTPEATAAIAADQSITYRDLDARANKVARIIQKRVSGRGQRVAVGLERSIDLLVALLAVHKAGHAYVPVDIDHPPERLRAILSAAGVAILICSSDGTAAIASGTAAVIRIDQQLDAINREDGSQLTGVASDGQSAAYVIFTSGTTGAPKGVEVSHRALANFMSAMTKKPGFGNRDCIVAVTTVSFDIAALELFLPLTVGGRVVIATRDDVRSGTGLVELIDRHGASVLQATPSLWRLLLEAGFKPSRSLRMLCGGEPLTRDLADKLLSEPGVELWNMYGPTETTVWSSTGRVSASDISIGEPIANTQLHVLDARGELCVIGALGTLYIGGEGLASGYFGQAAATAASFQMVSINGRRPERLYCTGDLARRRPDGRINLVGRADQQVKLRGFRIELEEVETVVRNAPGIAAAAVALRVDALGEDRLVCFYSALPGSAPASAELATHVAARLPDYMCPAFWILLDRMPTNGNGKLDRKALPSPELDASPMRQPVQPRSAIEIMLAAIWNEVLGRTDVSTTDSLFALGADSLHLFRIAARLAERGLPLKAKDLLQHPSIAALAPIVAAAQANPRVDASTPSLAAFRGGGRRKAKP